MGRNKTNRLQALFLSAVMIANLFPAAAYAGEEPGLVSMALEDQVETEADRGCRAALMRGSGGSCECRHVFSMMPARKNRIVLRSCHEMNYTDKQDV